MPSGDFRPPSTDWQQGYDAGYREAYRRTCGDAAIEREARHQALTDAIAAVEGLIEERGGRCVRPDDYDPGDINICEQHSELIFEDGCEDQPYTLLAVIDTLTRLLRGET